MTWVGFQDCLIRQLKLNIATNTRSFGKKACVGEET